MKTLFFLSILRLSAATIADYFGGSNNQDYLNWIASVNYKSSLFLASDADPANGAAVHWTLSPPYVEIGVAVRASGWLGFGLSENGGMTGTDMFLFEAKSPNVVTDAYVTEIRSPQIDDCQDWEFVDSRTDGEFLIVQVRRKLLTDDVAQDLPIRDDADYVIPLQRIIAAWGDSDSIGYHGQNVARGAIRWFDLGAGMGAGFEELMKVEATGYFFVGASRYLVRPTATVYKYFCVSGNDLRLQNVPLDSGVTVIGIEPVITSKYIHHMDAHARWDENNGNKEVATEQEKIYEWASGNPDFALPEDVGIPFGGESGYRSICLQIHFNNPTMTLGGIDNSGIKLHYRLTPRKYDLGVLLLGDPYVKLNGMKVGMGTSRHTFECAPVCSATTLVDEPVTVIWESLHMHRIGVSAYNFHFRNGQLIRTGRAEYHEFDQQSTQMVVQEPFQILPGDSFQTTCFFRNQDDKNLEFGPSSSDEMCIALLYYYPRKQMSSGSFSWYCGYGFEQRDCNSTWTTEVLADSSGLNRTFGQPSTKCNSN